MQKHFIFFFIQKHSYLELLHDAARDQQIPAKVNIFLIMQIQTMVTPTQIQWSRRRQQLFLLPWQQTLPLNVRHPTLTGSLWRFQMVQSHTLGEYNLTNVLRSHAMHYC